MGSGGEGDREALSILYTNAQSVIRKMDELRSIVEMRRPNVIALTETWTNEDIDDGFLSINGYELIERKDRTDTAMGGGGGIVVYVDKSKCAWKVEVGGDFSQCACVKVKGRRRDLAIFVVYRSPNSSKPNDESLCKLMKEMTGDYVVIGDFNYPGIRWASGGSDAKGRAFYDVIEDNYMIQHVDEPTHINGNILDLIISREDNLVQRVRMEGRLGKSDHEIMMADLQLAVDENAENVFIRNYSKADYQEMRNQTRSLDWTEELTDKDTEESWQVIKGFLEKMVTDYVPWKKRKRNNAPPWMTKEIKKALQEKKKAWDSWKRRRGGEEKRVYKESESRVKRLIRNGKNGIERQIAKDSKTNPKRFFSFVNSSRRNRSTIGPLTGTSDEIVTDPRQKAEVMNDYFATVFTRRNDEPPSKEPIGIHKIDDIVINAERVVEALDRMREHSAPGPDDVTNKLMIELKNEISLPLAMLFRKSLDEMKIPNDWRLSNVTPIYKQKGSKSDPGNYRPVSLTSNVCKLMERVVNVELSDFLEKRVLSNTQHGFRKGRSCQTNLIEFQDKVTGWIDDGNSVDVLYVDFKKAFDKVDHGRLITKLKAAGVEGKLWGWLKDWLSGRFQRVMVNGKASGWVMVESGVPQGTVLGGPLFTVFIDDIDEFILALIRKFADDTKMARIVNNHEDARRFQEDIDRLSEWANQWAMEYNQAKCKIMHLGRTNQRFKYEMGGAQLAETEEERDLGVLVDSSLKPSTQCQTAAKNANRVLGLIIKSFHYRTKSTLIPLYTSLVRPKLEHAAAAWSPYLEKDIECIEKVQRRLVRTLSNVRGETYEDKLRDAGLTT